MRKKLSSLALLLLLVLSVFSVLNVGITGVSAVESPAIYVDPATITGGTTFNVSIYTDYNGNDVFGWEFTLTYNPLVLNGTSVTNGNLTTGIYDMWSPGTFDNINGRLSLTGNGLFNPVNETFLVTNGPGILANVTFTVVGTGDSDITLGTETKLIGYNTTTGEKYNIIDAVSMAGQIGHGYFSNTTPIHNVAVAGVSASPTEVYASELVTITVNVTNSGNVNERFDVTAYYGNIAIETQTVQNLTDSATQSLNFIWNTTNTAGNHTISAEASDVGSTQVNETSLADNTLSDGTVLVRGIGLSVTPEEVIDTALVGGTSFEVNITITDAYNLTTAVFNITWNLGKIDLIGIVAGGFLNPGTFETVNGTFLKPPKNKTIPFTSVTYTRTTGVSNGNGTLAILTFEVMGRGGSDISIEQAPTWHEVWWRTIPEVTNGIFANNFDITVDEVGITDVPLLQLIYNTPAQWWTPGMETYGIIDVYPTWKILFPVTVTIINNGFLLADFNVTFTVDNGALVVNETLPVLVLGGFTKGVTFTWNVTNADLGDYNITGVISTLFNETSTADNELTVLMTVKMTGDIDRDADVDGADYFLFSGSYGAARFEVGYSLDADLNADGAVDGEDYWRFSGNYGLNTTAYS